MGDFWLRRGVFGLVSGPLLRYAAVVCAVGGLWVSVSVARGDSPSLSTALAVSAGTAVPGDVLVYTATVTNLSATDAASGVTVSFTLPSGLVTSVGPAADSALATLAPGMVVTARASYVVPPLDAKRPDESDAAYLGRLGALNGLALSASASASASAVAPGTPTPGPPTSNTGAGNPGAASKAKKLAPPITGAALLPRPSKSVCLSGRAFTIHIAGSRNVAFRSVTVTVNGKFQKKLKGRHLTDRIDLRGFHHVTARVRIRAVTSGGRVITGERVYHPCVKRRRPGKKRHILGLYVFRGHEPGSSRLGLSLGEPLREAKLELASVAVASPTGSAANLNGAASQAATRGAVAAVGGQSPAISDSPSPRVASAVLGSGSAPGRSSNCRSCRSSRVVRRPQGRAARLPTRSP